MACSVDVTASFPDLTDITVGVDSQVEAALLDPNLAFSIRQLVASLACTEGTLYTRYVKGTIKNGEICIVSMVPDLITKLRAACKACQKKGIDVNGPVEIFATCPIPVEVSGGEIEVTNTCDNPIGTEICNWDEMPLGIEASLAPVGCIFDGKEVIGKVFVCKKVDEGTGVVSYDTIAVMTDGTTVDPYTGEWESCDVELPLAPIFLEIPRCEDNKKVIDLTQFSYKPCEDWADPELPEIDPASETIVKTYATGESCNLDFDSEIYCKDGVPTMVISSTDTMTEATTIVEEIVLEGECDVYKETLSEKVCIDGIYVINFYCVTEEGVQPDPVFQIKTEEECNKECPLPVTPECLTKRTYKVGYDNGVTPGSSTNDCGRQDFIKFDWAFTVTSWSVNGQNVEPGGTALGPFPGWTPQLQGWADYFNSVNPNSANATFGFLPAPTWRFAEITGCGPTDTYGPMVLERDNGCVYTVYPVIYDEEFETIYRFATIDCDGNKAFSYCQLVDGVFVDIEAPEDLTCYVPCGYDFGEVIEAESDCSTTNYGPLCDTRTTVVIVEEDLEEESCEIIASDIYLSVDCNAVESAYTIDEDGNTTDYEVQGFLAECGDCEPFVVPFCKKDGEYTGKTFCYEKKSKFRYIGTLLDILPEQLNAAQADVSSIHGLPTGSIVVDYNVSGNANGGPSVTNGVTNTYNFSGSQDICIKVVHGQFITSGGTGSTDGFTSLDGVPYTFTGAAPLNTGFVDTSNGNNYEVTNQGTGLDSGGLSWESEGPATGVEIYTDNSAAYNNNYRVLVATCGCSELREWVSDCGTIVKWFDGDTEVDITGLEESDCCNETVKTALDCAMTECGEGTPGSCDYTTTFKTSGLTSFLTSEGEALSSAPFDFSPATAGQNASNNAAMATAEAEINAFLAANGGGTATLRYDSTSVLIIDVVGAAVEVLSADDDSNPGPHAFEASNCVEGTEGGECALRTTVCGVVETKPDLSEFKDNCTTAAVDLPTTFTASGVNPDLNGNTTGAGVSNWNNLTDIFDGQNGTLALAGIDNQDGQSNVMNAQTFTFDFSDVPECAKIEGGVTIKVYASMENIIDDGGFDAIYANFQGANGPIAPSSVASGTQGAVYGNTYIYAGTPDNTYLVGQGLSPVGGAGYYEFTVPATLADLQAGGVQILVDNDNPAVDGGEPALDAIEIDVVWNTDDCPEGEEGCAIRTKGCNDDRRDTLLEQLIENTTVVPECAVEVTSEPQCLQGEQVITMTDGSTRTLADSTYVTVVQFFDCNGDLVNILYYETANPDVAMDTIPDIDTCDPAPTVSERCIKDANGVNWIVTEYRDEGGIILGTPFYLQNDGTIGQPAGAQSSWTSCEENADIVECEECIKSLFLTYATAEYTISTVTFGGDDVSANFTLPVDGNNAVALAAFKDEMVAFLELQGIAVDEIQGRDGWTLQYFGDDLVLGTGGKNDIVSSEECTTKKSLSTHLDQCTIDALALPRTECVSYVDSGNTEEVKEQLGSIESTVLIIPGTFAGKGDFGYTSYEANNYGATLATIDPARIITPAINPSCNLDQFGTIIINPGVQPDAVNDYFEVTLETLDNSAGWGPVRAHCVTSGQWFTASPIATGPNTITYAVTHPGCAPEDMRITIAAFGSQSNSPETCDEVAVRETTYLRPILEEVKSEAVLVNDCTADATQALLSELLVAQQTTNSLLTEMVAALTGDCDCDNEEAAKQCVRGFDYQEIDVWDAGDGIKWEILKDGVSVANVFDDVTAQDNGQKSSWYTNMLAAVNAIAGISVTTVTDVASNSGDKPVFEFAIPAGCELQIVRNGADTLTLTGNADGTVTGTFLADGDNIESETFVEC